MSTIRTAAAAALLLGATSAHAISITILPSSAPNFFGSPSWATYNTDGLNSIENLGGASTGDRNTDPTAWETSTTFAAGDVVVSSFESWRGVANPAAPFDQEHGNRLHFGLHILGEGTQFTLEDLFYDLDGQGAGDVLDFAGNFAGAGYSSSRRGVNYGSDGIKGTGDDVIATNGSDLIDELVYIGVGNAFDASFGTGTDQENIDAVLPTESFDIVMTYGLFDGTGGVLASNSITATVSVPAPAPWVLLALPLAGLGLRRRPA